MECQTFGEAGLLWVPLSMTTQTVTLMNGHLSSQESVFRRAGTSWHPRLNAVSAESSFPSLAVRRRAGIHGLMVLILLVWVCVSRPGLLVMDDGGGGLGLFLISKMTLQVRLREKCSPEPPEPWIFLVQV